MGCPIWGCIGLTQGGQGSISLEQLCGEGEEAVDGSGLRVEPAAILGYRVFGSRLSVGLGLAWFGGKGQT